MKSFIKIFFFVLTITILLPSCGEGTVEIGQNTYSPKIVIEAIIYPGKKIDNIRITRNIPLNADVDPKTLILANADVRLFDLQTNKEFRLTFNPKKFAFEYNNTDLKIEYNKSYKLSVAATIDGKFLQATSITKVPRQGFRIYKDESILGSMRYRENDSNGNLMNFKIAFEPSPGTDFYAVSIVALDASDSTFIFNNAYFNVNTEELWKNLDNYKYRMQWLQNIRTTANRINYEVKWFDTWFFGNYRVIIYAADENFRLYVQTHKNVQEFDGNFHEPRLNIQGDGIGVFGSAIADTAYFYIQK